jgi:nucleoside-diphosphate-sugar epimerase
MVLDPYFSVFGEHENTGWLIPSVISKLLKNESIPLTRCEQQYNYLYIDDFVSQFLSVIQLPENKSGIYNLCNSESITLKDLLIQIANLMGLSQKMLQFGAIPYRAGQNMLIAGDNSKFRSCFANNDNAQLDLANGLLKIIEFHKKKQI